MGPQHPPASLLAAQPSPPPRVLAHHSPVKMKQWFGDWGWHPGTLAG